MGTPEFPNLGKHCSAEYCKQIDFLPFTCDRCSQVFCLDHRSYINHSCPKADRKDVTVVICPLCAKSVRLNPDEDANITWETHVNTECDPSSYEANTKKKKCPVHGCREALTFSNTLKCRDCLIDHCLKHRFGPDHKCPGPKKPDTFPFMNLLNRSKKEPARKPVSSSPSSSSSWSSFLSAASSVRASAEASMSKLGDEINQKWRIAKESVGPSGGNGGSEECPQCSARFSSVGSLVEHVERVHERSSAKKVTIDACPKCSKGFRDPVALVEHVERDHGGRSRA